MEKFNLITNSAVELGDDLTAESNGKGRKFVSRFIESGVAHYENFGDVLITKETLNKFINTMVGCPVIIKHKDITDENADKERVGVVSDVWFNENDGWFYCSGIIWNKQAIDLVKNQGWNVSCTYDFESDKEAKTHNGKKIDMEFTDGNFLHLALVDNPRYERANIVVNSKDIVENDKWITVKPNGEDETGRHLLIKDGEDVGDAMRRQWGVQAKGQQNLFTAKERKSFKLEKKEEQPKEDKTPKYMDSKKEGNTELFYDDDEEEYYTQDYFDAISKDYDNFMKAKKEENKPFEISEDYKNSVKDYTKEKHEQAADFYGEKMATAQKKSVANPDNEDYKKQFEEYQAYTHWHEEQAQTKEGLEKETPHSQKDDDRHQKIRDLEEKAYKEFKTLHDNYIQGDVKLSDFQKATEKFNKEYKDAFDKLESDRFVSFEDFAKRENKQPESPFGEGVEIKEHNKKGYMLDSKNLKSYQKGDKFAILDDWSHEDKERYTVSFHEGKKRVSTKTYSTKRGMEKAIREHLQGGDNKETKALATKTDLEAAKTRYNDVLKKYNEASHKRWKSGITPEEYHQAWVDYEKYKKELTGARREYAESIMSNFVEVENNPYEQRQADRQMRYEEMARKTEAESNRIARQADEMFSVIPMGQPIIGQRDANFRKRIWGKMDTAYKLSKKAGYYADKAASVGSAGISSDDANAIAKLAQKYKSGVDSAEKRRIIDRVIDLHKRATSTKPESEATDYGFSIERNKDLNRLQLKFDNIPDANTRAILKSNGFRWSPREKAWQRQLNGNAEYSLKSIMSKMKAENSLFEGIEDILKNHTITKDDLPILEGLKNIIENI